MSMWRGLWTYLVSKDAESTMTWKGLDSPLEISFIFVGFEWNFVWILLFCLGEQKEDGLLCRVETYRLVDFVWSALNALACISHRDNLKAICYHLAITGGPT